MDGAAKLTAKGRFVARLLIGIVWVWFGLLILAPTLALLRAAFSGGFAPFWNALTAPEVQRNVMRSLLLSAHSGPSANLALSSAALNFPFASACAACYPSRNTIRMMRWNSASRMRRSGTCAKARAHLSTRLALSSRGRYVAGWHSCRLHGHSLMCR